MSDLKFEVGKRYRSAGNGPCKCIATYADYAWLVGARGPFTEYHKENWTEIPDIDLDMFPAKAKWAWTDEDPDADIAWSSSNPNAEHQPKVWGVIIGYEISDDYTRENPLDLDQLRKDLA